MQSRRHSLYETLSNTTIGFIGSWIIVFLVLRFVPLSPAAAATLNVVLCTVWSIARGYFNRRYWNKRTYDMRDEPTIITNVAASILNWFERAMPTPTDKNRSVQLGVHYEEVAETIKATGDEVFADELESLAKHYKTDPDFLMHEHIDRKEFLDGLMDTVVTAIGTGYVFGFDVLGALEAVNENNWAKFVNGQPQFDENGKIIKPAGHTKVDLTPFLTRFKE